MWQLTSPVTRRLELDFSHSGQSSTLVNQLLDGNLQLINAIEHVHWGDAELQFIICEACGIPRCQPGNWIKLARTESLALIIPAFTLLDEAPKPLQDEYMPPHYLLERGIIFIEQEYYDDIFCQLANSPSFCTLEPLTAWEAGRVFQLEAPYRVLGDLRSTPKLIDDIVMASSEGSFMEQVEHLELLLAQLLAEKRPVILRSITKQDQVISFYLDLAGIPEWPALSYDGSQYALYLEPGYILA